MQTADGTNFPRSPISHVVEVHTTQPTMAHITYQQVYPQTSGWYLGTMSVQDAAAQTQPSNCEASNIMTSSAVTSCCCFARPLRSKTDLPLLTEQLKHLSQLPPPEKHKPDSESSCVQPRSNDTRPTQLDTLTPLTYRFTINLSHLSTTPKGQKVGFNSLFHVHVHLRYTCCA